MATVHGKLTVITAATKDISAWTKTSSYERTADVHDSTGYGKDDRTKDGGVRDGKFTCGGAFDNTVTTGTRAVFGSKEGTKFAMVLKMEGTGTGKPQDSFTAVLAKYVQTAPFDDLVQWSAEFEIDGPVTATTQP